MSREGRAVGNASPSTAPPWRSMASRTRGISAVVCGTQLGRRYQRHRSLHVHQGANGGVHRVGFWHAEW